MTESKTCTKCGLEKPLLDYYKRKDSLDGLHGQCKCCYKDAQRRKPYIPVSTLDIDVSGSKQCRICNKVKPKTEFNKKADAKDGLESSCKECRRSGQRKLKAEIVRLALEQKVCKKCLKTKPSSDFFIAKHLKEGLSSNCKECTRTCKSDNKEKRIYEQSMSGMQRCQTCEKEIPVAELSGGVGGAQCQNCRRQQDVKYLQAHPSCHLRVRPTQIM